MTIGIRRPRDRDLARPQLYDIFMGTPGVRPLRGRFYRLAVSLDRPLGDGNATA